MTLREQVREFHEAYGCPVEHSPAIPDEERVRLRLRLIAEEFLELLEACLGSENYIWVGRRGIVDAIEYSRIEIDLVGLADACADLDYVVEGTRLEFGIDGGPIADEVHRSNMSKLDSGGRPVIREDGKVMKGPHYSPPDIVGCLVRQGWGK